MTEKDKSTTVETEQVTESKPETSSASTDNHRAPRNFKKDDHKDGHRNDHRRNDRRSRAPKDDFEEKVVTINRVTKVTKGGRHFRFAAVVVVGNRKGQIGFGVGKANEVPDAIKKGVKEARKNLVKVSLRGTTVPHEILGQYGAGKVLIKPAKEGTGVIAGGPARAVIELAGISDIYAKSLGSNTPINMIRATVDGLSRMESLQSVRALRYGQKNTTKPNTKENKKPAAKKEAEVK